MKLGIAVVYSIPEEDEKLLDLHLSQIEENTGVPYVIYAAAPRLSARLRLKLEQHAKVSIRELPRTDLRGASEHAFYLERLVAAAIEDGATHVCILHVDSFPVRAGWAPELAARLSGRCVLAGVMRCERYDRKPMTALMMFTREFYLEHHPSFLLAPEVLNSAEYRRYAKTATHVADSGVGYGFKIFSEGLSWVPLTRSDKGPEGWGFGIYGDTVFHLGGTVSHGNRSTGGWPARLDRLRRAIGAVLPRSMWVPIARAAPQRILNKVAASRIGDRKPQLIADPQAFLERLRTGQIGDRLRNP